eukprot:scaffold34597_cov177-Amphora_coffeaeformis.AAC.14
MRQVFTHVEKGNSGGSKPDAYAMRSPMPVARSLAAASRERSYRELGRHNALTNGVNSKTEKVASKKRVPTNTHNFRRSAFDTRSSCPAEACDSESLRGIGGLVVGWNYSLENDLIGLGMENHKD